MAKHKGPGRPKTTPEQPGGDLERKLRDWMRREKRDVMRVGADLGVSYMTVYRWIRAGAKMRGKKRAAVEAYMAGKPIKVTGKW